MFKKEGGEQAKKQKKKGRIHHGIEIPCFLRQLINKKAKKQVEMDIVGISIDNLAGFFGECKWKNELISKSILETLIYRSSLFTYPKKYYYLFSEVGFTDECKKLAKKVNCHLISFSEM